MRRLLPHVRAAALLSVLLAVTPARADEADEVPYPADWVVSAAVGYPASGLGVARTFAGKWRVQGTGGMFPIPIVGFGGALEASRAMALGPIALHAGISAGGVWSDGCSFGGCGDPFWFYGAGPLVGISRDTKLGPVYLHADLSGGAIVAIRALAMPRVQPQVSLRFGVGW